MIKPRKKNGGWIAQPMVTLANGKRKRIFVKGETRNEVLTQLHDLQDKERKRLPYSDKEWTVGEYLDYWLDTIQKKHICEMTYSSYSSVIRNHIKPTLGYIRITHLSADDLECALDTLEDNGYKGSVLQKYYQVLSTCLKHAERKGVVFRNIAQLVDKPKYESKEILIWTIEQTRLFLKLYKNHRYYIALFLYVVYGMRRGDG